MGIVLIITLFANHHLSLAILAILLYILSAIFFLNPYLGCKIKEPSINWFKTLPFTRKILFILSFAYVFFPGPIT